MIQLKAYFLIVLAFFSSSLFAQSAEECIYGRITLTNGKQYDGQLRWGNEEATWSDLLEAYKDKPQIQEKIDVRGYEESRGNDNGLFDMGFMQLWENRDPKSKFYFKCYFGQISRIDADDEKHATIYFKDNEKIELKRRGNDIGSDITLFDDKLGKLQFEWENIKTIQFFEAPKRTVNQLGSPVYGRLLTADGTYEGYIVWGNQESFTKDPILGQSNGTDVSIPFGDIVSLKPESEGSQVWTKNNKEFYLKGTSDVKLENHGVLVKTQKFGGIRIDWSDIVKIDFIPPAFKLDSYHQYGPPVNLDGVVETLDHKVYSGKLIYDLDETWDFEILDGKSGGVRYFLPFNLVSKVEPQNYNYSLVTLKDNSQKLLGESSDVCHRNNGILIWLTEQKTKYIPWDEVKRITFK